MLRFSKIKIVGLLIIPLFGSFGWADDSALQDATYDSTVVVGLSDYLLAPLPASASGESTLDLNSWWLEHMPAPQRASAAQVSITLESLLVRAVTHSSQIKVFSELPLIRRTAITEAYAAFDPARFVDSRWIDSNDPVGSTLTGVPLNGRYKNNQFTSAVGLRKRTYSGGLLESSQQFGVQDTNSSFFSPDPQGTSRLRLSYTHPLLRGSGQRYNMSLACLAKIDTNIAEAEFSRQLQSHLNEVARSYWGLHIARANVVIHQKSLSRATEILDRLRTREGIDVVRVQILRAEAEAAARESTLARAMMTVRTSEARIRALVNDPDLGSWETTELIAMDAPCRQYIPIDLQTSLESALTHRPEVRQAMLQVRAGCVRQRMSDKEVLPVLNAVTEAYVAGLQNDASVGDAWLDQFRAGGPGYAVGMEFQQPIGNRAALARQQRQTLELRRHTNQYETTLHSLKLEVGVAVREVAISWEETAARQAAMEAFRAQMESTIERWQLLPGDNGNGALVMESMLRDQERLAKTESALLQSWISYNMALFGLRKTTGELVSFEQVSWQDYCNEIQVRQRSVSKPNLGESPTFLPNGGITSDVFELTDVSQYPSQMTRGRKATACDQGPMEFDQGSACDQEPIR